MSATINKKLFWCFQQCAILPEMKAQGRKVHYLAYGEQAALTGMDDVLSHIAETSAPQKIFVTEPSEYRLSEVLRAGRSSTFSYHTRYHRHA